MIPYLNRLLSDRTGDTVFRCFDVWHLSYIAVTAAVIAAVCLALRKSGPEAKEKVQRSFINMAFGLYVLDLFLMPFAYGEIDVEKLPFHICTAMCVGCFATCHAPSLKGMRVHFALLGFISNLVYLIYPAGVMWHRVSPFSYRVIQTLAFHAIMTVYGLLTLIYNREKLRPKELYKDMILITAMTLWAMLGNFFYSDSLDPYSPRYNWFFVTADPFGILKGNVALIVMPLVNVALFFAVTVLIYCVFALIRKIEDNRRVNKREYSETFRERPK